MQSLSILFALASTFVVTAEACWSISSGTCTQSTYAGYQCVQSGNYPSNYNDNDRCSFHATEDMTWQFVSFSTERDFDTLTAYSVGLAYSGTGWASGTPAGSSRKYGTNGDDGRFEWRSDGSGPGSGWLI